MTSESSKPVHLTATAMPYQYNLQRTQRKHLFPFVSLLLYSTIPLYDINGIGIYTTQWIIAYSLCNSVFSAIGVPRAAFVYDIIRHRHVMHVSAHAHSNSFSSIIDTKLNHLNTLRKLFLCNFIVFFIKWITFKYYVNFQACSPFVQGDHKNSRMLSLRMTLFW